MGGLYWVYDDQERHYDAECLRTEMLQIELGMHGVGYGGNMGALAHTYHHLGKYKEAESLYDKILEIARRERKITFAFILFLRAILHACTQPRAGTTRQSYFYVKQSKVEAKG